MKTCVIPARKENLPAGTYSCSRNAIAARRNARWFIHTIAEFRRWTIMNHITKGLGITKLREALFEGWFAAQGR
ncbi:MAG: hypothetical protein A2W52_03255 [Candidatus Taylorbacteria bacterium RIFCSPHIGHO2_02_49_25]|uniref:Uncharacterized protein n=1 Tax=Candidatus Taylorbacteria bacterium RIFCSPHIGHO2_02_49_25 TaxID=1802305 RepID=A0A1G2MDK7_9BACT|nr:MAG: hypothetical protein A2W52_03255 [Candidatus Taylorbacteria bacterium RIFCSPHIGHO2_02_49_25]OHA45738.1 MAG: hypothetical protein A3G61_02975 [Candidatus Taylorbacteria bacterium RIFCSPLOWO2_12_FULL_49_67]